MHAHDIDVGPSHGVAEKFLGAGFRVCSGAAVGFPAVYHVDGLDKRGKHMPAFDNQGRDKEGAIGRGKVLEGQGPQQRRVHECSAETLGRHALDRKELPEKNGVPGVKPAEMKGEKPQQKQGHADACQEGGRSVLLPRIALPGHMHPGIGATENGGQDGQVSQYQAAEPQAPDQVRGFPFKKPCYPKPDAKGDNVGKYPPGQGFFMRSPTGRSVDK